MHQSVLRIKEKSWTAGITDPSKANYHVAQDRLEAEVTWQKGRKSRIEPFVDSEGHQGIRIIVERGS
tara:strand:- start:437 stop:637 length:201 start_codon:yes stop_codon:yes gene_type:complete